MIISFVDSGLFISQNKSISYSNANLFCNYNIISSFLIKFRLVVEYGKTEVFHLSRLYGVFNLPPLNLTTIGGPILLPKTSWQYLSFLFNWKLTFQHHIDFYTNKAISTVKCMKMLGNLLREINSLQKIKLYKCCVLSIMLYRFLLWYYNKAPINYYLSILHKIQRRAALWISDTFYTSPITEIKATSSLIPIHLHLKKLYERFLLRESSLSPNHIINSILSSDGLHKHNSYNISINNLIFKQRLCLKSVLIDVNNRYNKLFPSFSFFNEEFNPGNCLIDFFLDQFSFYLCSLNIKKHIENLDDIAFRALSNPSSSIIISDASIKNHIAMSILHIHLYNKPIIKTIHKVVNITITKAKLFAIRCNINQAVGRDKKIVCLDLNFSKYY